MEQTVWQSRQVRGSKLTSHKVKGQAGTRQGKAPEPVLDDLLTLNKLSTAAQPASQVSQTNMQAPYAHGEQDEPDLEEACTGSQPMYFQPLQVEAGIPSRPSRVQLGGRNLLPPISMPGFHKAALLTRCSSAQAAQLSIPTPSAAGNTYTLQRRMMPAYAAMSGGNAADGLGSPATNTPNTDTSSGPVATAADKVGPGSLAATEPRGLRHSMSAPGPFTSRMTGVGKDQPQQQRQQQQGAGWEPTFSHQELLAACQQAMDVPTAGGIARVGNERPPSGELVFDADYEGGNLATIKRSVDGTEYELTLRHDTNNNKYRLWFHFCVCNAHPGQQVVFTITNFSKARSLFRHGMTPVVRSASRPQWCRVPARNTFYYKASKTSKQYLLSFAFIFDDPHDTYEFAYSFPFTYTALQCELQYLDSLQHPYCRRQLLTRSPQMRKVDLLCISQPMRPCPTTHNALTAVAAAAAAAAAATAITPRPGAPRRPTSSVPLHPATLPCGTPAPPSGALPAGADAQAQHVTYALSCDGADVARGGAYAGQDGADLAGRALGQGGSSQSGQSQGDGSRALPPRQTSSTGGYGSDSNSGGGGDRSRSTAPRKAASPAARVAAAAADGAGVAAGTAAGPVQQHRRRVVCVTGRVHPGETPASFLIQGLLSFLLSSEAEAVALRSELTFLITPMLNPDGAFLGNYRCDAGGVDLNRMWAVAGAAAGGALPALHSQMDMLSAYHNNPHFQVDLFIDVHAHSTSRSSFMFCNRPSTSSPNTNNNSAPASDALSAQAALERVVRLPRLLEAVMPGFSLSSCVFDDDRAKAGCARRAVGSLIPDALSYTLEVSFFHASQEVVVMTSPGQTLPVAFNNTIEGYLEMGKQLALAIHQLYGVGSAAAAVVADEGVGGTQNSTPLAAPV